MAKTLKITLVHSPIGNRKNQKATVQALGLRRIRQVVEHSDTQTVRGMVATVRHLVAVEEVEA